MQTVRKQKTAAEATAALTRLCARAEKSSGDARRLMRGWGVPQSEAERVLTALVESGFIDDGRFAEAYVREKLRFSGWGARKIAAALAAKGVAREIVNAALNAHLDSEAQTGRLEKQLARKLPRTKADTAYDLRAKLMRYGLSLGYDYDTVRDAMERLRI